MGLLKKLTGTVIAGAAAYGAVKVAKRYQDNKDIEKSSVAAGEIPAKKETGEIIGDIARATAEVVEETGIAVADAVGTVVEKIKERRELADLEELAECEAECEECEECEEDEAADDAEIGDEPEEDEEADEEPAEEADEDVEEAAEDEDED